MNQKGFTLIEVLIGVAIFVMVSLAAYKGFIGLSDLVRVTQYKIAAINLINEQFELVRNLPYKDIGVVGSIPSGKIDNSQTIIRSGIPFDVLTTIRNIDLEFDGTIGGTPNDLSPADNKLVEVTISCDTCKRFVPLTLTTIVAPKNLETASNNGALFIKVFDANGVPVQGADVHIENTLETPTITIDDTTNAEGLLQLVDVPPGVEAYEITVSKDGYSTERTYLSGEVSNPNPIKPNATVLLQQVTQVSFTIDITSSLLISSLTDSCSAVGSINFTLVGNKEIGAGIPKSDTSRVTNGSGALTIEGLEWDTYTINSTDGSYDLIGLNPLNPVFVNPNTTQNVQLIVASKDPQSLLVTVKDGITLLPLTDATVILEKTGFEETLTTGRGYLSQTDWSGGSGQDDIGQANRYSAHDGNIDSTGTPGDLKLADAFGTYVTSGDLTSSVFDTGSPSNFHQLIWNPTDQPPSAGLESIKFQIATNATNTATTTWTYKGPDGTGSTYYTFSNSTIHSGHDDDRYFRYKAFLSTENPALTPNLSEVSFTFTTSCTPPGQVIFSGLTNDTYTLGVDRAGYASTSLEVITNAPWKEQEVLLMPD
ncbi:MAG: carboxypeptidase regulatory-like domain-containing protein [Patescibacteria group bacterium]